MTDWLVRIGMACYVLDLPEDREEAQEVAWDAVLYWPCEYDSQGAITPRGKVWRASNGLRVAS